MKHLLLLGDAASGAVEAVRDGLPVPGQVDHVPGVQNAIAEQVVELEAGAVDGPVVLAFRVVQVVPLGSQHGQMLYVAPV